MRAFRLAAIGTVVVAAVNIIPAVDAMTVPHALTLLDAKDGILVRSGGNRIASAIRRHPARREDFIRQGAFAKLSKCILRESFGDRGVVADEAVSEVRRTRDVLFDALIELAAADEVRKLICAHEDLITLIESESNESDAASKLYQIVGGAQINETFLPRIS